jgi:hypothetical protein
MFELENILTFLPIILIALIFRVIDSRRKQLLKKQEEESRRQREQIMEAQEEDDDEIGLPPWIIQQKEEETRTEVETPQHHSVFPISEEAPVPTPHLVSESTVQEIPIAETVRVNNTVIAENTKPRASISSKISRLPPLKQGLLWSEILGKPKGLSN